MRTWVVLLLLVGGCQSAPTPTPSATPAPALAKEPLLPWGDAPPDATEKLQVTAAAIQANSRLRALEQLRALEPMAATSSDVAERLSRFYERLGYIDKAYQFAVQAVTIAPKSASALLRLARVEQDTGYTAQAREHYNAAIATQPDAIETHLAIAPLLELELQLPEAEKELRSALARDGANPGIWGVLAQNLTQQGRYAEARAALDQVEQLAPGAPPALLERGNIALQEAKRTPQKAAALLAESRKHLDACLSADPQNAKAALLLGLVALEEGKPEAARGPLEKAYALQPALPELRVHLGRLLVRLGEKARGAALQADAHRAASHREQLQRLAGRVASAPDDLARHRELARWCGQNQEGSHALLEWGQVLRLAPGDPEAKAEVAKLTSQRLRSESGSGRG